MLSRMQTLESYSARIQPFLLKGNYAAALKVAREARRAYPDAIEAQYMYAKILGDDADEAAPARRKKLKAEATEILKSLLRRLRGLRPHTRYGICLNYYYQSEKNRAMYQFGKRFAEIDKSKGNYAQGLAAGLIAFKEYEATRIPQSVSWAKKSVKAWERYDLKKEKYYFAHYSFAKALALAGEKAKALARLKIAARLGKRPVTDWEFADVLKIIESPS